MSGIESRHQTRAPRQDSSDGDGPRGSIFSQNGFGAQTPESSLSVARASQVWGPLGDLLAVQGIHKQEVILQFAKHQLISESDEHAHRSALSTHEGHLQEGKFMMNGFDMLEATQNALRAEPGNTRTKAEYLSLRQVMQNIRDMKGAQFVFSPAKVAGYGILFITIPVYQPDGRIHILQKVLLYDEPLGTFDTTTRIRQSLLKMLHLDEQQVPSFTSPEQHVTTPISLKDTHVPSDDTLLRLLGREPGEKARAMQFRALLNEYMADEIREYGELLIEYSRSRGDLSEFTHRASHIKDRVFAVGKKLAHAMRTEEWGDFNTIMQIVQSERNGARVRGDIMTEMMLRNAAMVVGGTQCPSIPLPNPTGMDMLVRQHLDVMKNHGSEWAPYTIKDCVQCPTCRTISSNREGRFHYKKGETWSCLNPSCTEHKHGKDKLPIGEKRAIM